MLKTKLLNDLSHVKIYSNLFIYLSHDIWRILFQISQEKIEKNEMPTLIKINLQSEHSMF